MWWTLHWWNLPATTFPLPRTLVACSPLKPSYKDKPLARHYSEHHPNIPPQLLLSVIARASNIKDRKVKEARMISTLKPSINIKDELKDTQLFLVQSKWVLSVYLVIIIISYSTYFYHFSVFYILLIFFFQSFSSSDL